MIRVFGQITDASGKGVAGAMIELRALKSSTEVLYGSVFTYKCDASGHYEFPLAIGAYDVYAQNDICGDMDYLGTAVVTADTDDGDLHHTLVDGGINITPPMLDAAMEFALRAEKAATSAKSDRIQTGKDVIVTGQNKQVAETKAQESATSADEAKAARDSIVQDANEVRLNTQQVADNATSVASNTALVQRKAEQVAQNTQTVSTKALQVSENTQSVAANTQAVSLIRDEVVAKTSMAQAAADTATQKAASAAEHDAAAAEYARQAQEAAQATAGALIDGGAADLSTGVYPQPVQVSGTARPTFWKVTKGGTVGGVDYGVGDTLIYTVAGSGSYYKIDNTESVTSVQGEKGAVTLTPEKIGAEPAGTALAGMQQHISAPDPHSQYAQKTEVDAKGTAVAALSEHVSTAGVHSINSISGLSTSLANKYSPSNKPSPEDIGAISANKPVFFAAGVKATSIQANSDVVVSFTSVTVSDGVSVDAGVTRVTVSSDGLYRVSNALCKDGSVHQMLQTYVVINNASGSPRAEYRIHLNYNNAFSGGYGSTGWVTTGGELIIRLYKGESVYIKCLATNNLPGLLYVSGYFGLEYIKP
ncbi:prophage tail fiber N-terminal domain-containing protein [Plesiomonas shigelloides]|uniref:prophage tail fiber N-terminal domain-containing protein n=1 Tax=Plesiomonas shigelloides TaxID=703 RepID=UPI00126231AC|nr:carboxypeptidase-like regulatory domain-containing protein [Plesiomonas shigelloides]KAB7687368.1 hypothetical protein GBN28_11825 [Plesiomonas shigelloides]